jgi:hypothetical protein
VVRTPRKMHLDVTVEISSAFVFGGLQIVAD